MASLAESSIASVRVKDLAALQEHLLNHCGSSAANAPQVPKAANDDRPEHTTHPSYATKDASEDASAVVPDSADSYRTQNPSLHAHPPRLLSTKSAPPAEMETMMHLSPSQEAFRTMTRAGSFHGYPGGDTQPMDSQVYRNYIESMALAKSSTTTPKKTSPGEKQNTYDTIVTGRTPHMYMEGETGFIDLENAWLHDSPTARSATSGIDELLASPQTQLQVAEGIQKSTMPETPAMAGHKRGSSGEIVSSATAATKKTPVFSQLFGAAPKAAFTSATQLFGQTQAPSSPMLDALRSDPVVTRPSPSIDERVTVSSPPAFRSSPVVSMHTRPTALLVEPRDTYTSMQESDERRRAREQLEQQWQSMPTLEEVDFEVDDQDDGEQGRHQQSRIQRVLSDQTLNELSKMRAPLRPGSRPGSSRKQPATIDLVTPATVRRTGERLELDDFEEDSDVEMVAEEGDPDKVIADDQDESDVYDELAQTVLRSQPNDLDDDDDERNDHVSDDGGVAHEDRSVVQDEVPDDVERFGKPDGIADLTDAHRGAEAEKAVTVTQRSAVADSQPLHQERQSLTQVKGHTEPSIMSSFLPGSQYADKTSEEQATIGSSGLRRLAASMPFSGEQSEKVPSSPPRPDASSTLPDGSAESSLARRRALAQFQKPSNVTRRETTTEQEIPESDALVSDEVRPGTAQSALRWQVSVMGESNSVPAPFSTAQTHLSASGPSPAKGSSGLDKSPMKAFASQHSRLSADSPRKLAGVRRFADIAADPSPPEANGEADIDMDAILSDVLTAEDQAFIEAMSSPVSEKGSKRRKLAHERSSDALSRAVSPTKKAGKASLNREHHQLGTVEEHAVIEHPVLATGKIAEELNADNVPTILQSSPSKGNELPLATPHQADTPKSTQESVKKREKAGAAAVSQLLAARSTKSTRLAKLAGRGRKTAMFAESEQVAKATPKHLEVKTSNSKIARAGKKDLRDQGGGRAAQESTVDGLENAVPGLPEPAAPIDQADDATVPITGAHRVFALFKGTYNNFYPASLLSSSGNGKSHKVRFDYCRTVTDLEVHHVRALDLRVGDQVKVDGKDMRKQVWAIKGFANAARTDEERSMGTDIRGHTIAKVQAKTPRNSMPANGPIAEGESGLIDVFITNIYITHSLWQNFKGRVFTPPDAARSRDDRLSTPSTGLQTPDVETPGSRSRRKLAPAAKATSRTSHLREESVASGSSRTGAGLFAGMAFAISYGSNEAEKAEVTRRIESNGGIILDRGFDELFDQLNLDGDDAMTSPSKRAHTRPHLGGEQNGLQLKAAYQDLGFVALVADRHSRRAKYMQALALGLPTLSGRWITDSLNAASDSDGDAAPLPWSKYLLAAGESAYLGGAVRSRAIDTYSAAQAKLADVIASREKLVKGDGVLIVASKKHKATWERRKAYAFLTLALGAGSVKRVNDLAEAKASLAREPDKWRWVYVDGSVDEASASLFGQGTIGGGKKRKRGDEATPKANVKAMSAASADGGIRVVNDEFVVQSLILGALVG